jgi:hypothetical protein
MPPLRIGLMLFAFFALIYLGFRSNDHYYDSVDYALIVEGDGERLFWPKHILQHAFIKLIHQAQLAFGLGGRALRTAQAVNAVAAAGAVGCFFALLQRSTREAWLPACSALVLGFSAAVARHAVEGEVYALPLFFLCAALLAASSSTLRAAAALAGAAQAASVLMHQSYATFVPALGVYVFLRGGSRALGPWACALALPVFGVYGAVFAATGLPLAQLYGWLRPEAPWMPFGLHSLHAMGRSLLHALSPSESLSFSPAWLPAPIALVATLALGWRAAWLRFRNELVLCLLLGGIYVPVLIRQGPTFQYFPPLVVPILMASALSLCASERGASSRRVAAAYATGFAVLGTVLTLIPAHKRNDSLDRADFARNSTGLADRIVVLGAGTSTNDPVYFPYFANRQAISLWRLECCSDPTRKLLDKLDQQIDETLLAGARVFVFESMVLSKERFRSPLEGRLSIGGDALRDHLEKRYRLGPRNEYAGRGYSERLLEITRQSCGPEPHYKSIGGACLPSCGVLLNAQRLPPANGACCPRGCTDWARLLGRAWDCDACCAGEPPLCR